MCTGPPYPRLMNLKGKPAVDDGACTATPCSHVQCLFMHMSALRCGSSRAQGMSNMRLAENRMLPLENYGVRCMSMGFLMKVPPCRRMHSCMLQRIVAAMYGSYTSAGAHSYGPSSSTATYAVRIPCIFASVRPAHGAAGNAATHATVNPHSCEHPFLGDDCRVQGCACTG